MIEPKNPEMSIRKQCRLLGLNRRSYYYSRKDESAENLLLMRLIDREYTDHPFYGSRQMASVLRRKRHVVNRKRIQRLMRLMGLQAIYPKKRLSLKGPDSVIYPYLLRGVEVTHPSQVWAADITYVPMRNGFLYLVVVMDWYSRRVIAWELSNTLNSDFCVRTLEAALAQGCPKIFNTDQGSQFSCRAFTDKLKERGIQISMDGRGRAYDNIFVERFWRSVKYEEIYLKAYQDGLEARQELDKYFRFYNTERPHQGLEAQTPEEVYTKAA